MKKLLLLIATGTIAMGAYAQSRVNPSFHSSAPGKFDPARMVPGSGEFSLTPEVRAHAKATNAVIGSVQTFPGPNLPANWGSAAQANTQMFKYIDSSLNWIPVPNTPSGANGWVGIDANTNTNATAQATLT